MFPTNFQMRNLKKKSIASILLLPKIQTSFEIRKKIFLNKKKNKKK